MSRGRLRSLAVSLTTTGLDLGLFTLCTLMLEVYYRFLPTYKPIDLEKDAPVEEEEDEDDEIVIKFE